uniref:Uncharacterized protein n=1 Tax=Anguilla anguilla TaxID=7936 RepID=A0A0E9Y0B9_ANGAN
MNPHQFFSSLSIQIKQADVNLSKNDPSPKICSM